MSVISFPARIRRLAELHPDSPAVSCAGDALSWRDLDRRSTQLASALLGMDVTEGDMVTMVLPNGLEWFVTFFGILKTGAIPQPVSARMPLGELREIISLADCKLVVGSGAELSLLDRPVLSYETYSSASERCLPDVISPAWKAPTSGGSTGRPKIIVSGDSACADFDAAPPFPCVSSNETLLMPGPLYHNAPLIISVWSLLCDNSVVVLPRFDALQTLETIESQKVNTVYMVPTMMRRILRLPEDLRLKFDLSSIRILWHIAEPCPVWLKESWIEWLGADKIFEIYGGTEGQATTLISGEEWLRHKGSVGRPFVGEMMIGDSDGNPLPVGDVGEVWMRWTRDTPPYRYLGAQARRSKTGWESLGDIGQMDEEGYVYLRDRLQDMVTIGGANVYPAEVEAAMQAHPSVLSCCVVGLPDADTGNRLHAIVQCEGDGPTADEILEFLKQRLSPYKLPRSIEFVHDDLRDEAGKIRRSALRTQRLADLHALKDD